MIDRDMDRVHSLTVVLDKDMRSDDVESIINAIFCFKHVLAVGPCAVNVDTHMAQERARHELEAKLWTVLYKGEKL